MSLANVVVPVTPYTVLKWSNADRDKFVQRMPLGQIPPIFKEGVYAGRPFYIYQLASGEFSGRAMAKDPDVVRRAEKWEFIEDERREPICFDDAKDTTSD
jgi:hypothetical protein